LRIANDLGDTHFVANAAHQLALVCREAALHGEALEHLSEAVRLRHKLLAGLKNERVRNMARASQVELAKLGEQLLEEAVRVARSQEERQALQEITQRLDRVCALPGHRSLRRRLESLGEARGVPLWTWRTTLRDQAHERWKDRLLPGCFERLHEGTREGLVRAEVAYHGAVDDLGRSAHLLALAVERELRQRVAIAAAGWAGSEGWSPRGQANGLERRLRERPDRLSLGDLIGLVDGMAAAERQEASLFLKLRRRLSPDQLDRLRSISEGLGSLQTMDGKGLSLSEVRNAVAHGRSPADRLTRSEVDGLKRGLALTLPVVLREVAELRLG